MLGVYKSPIRPWFFCFTPPLSLYKHLQYTKYNFSDILHGLLFDNRPTDDRERLPRNYSLGSHLQVLLQCSHMPHYTNG